ncbi:MAG TPA: multicopper oxidase domain-containing protein [Stellaceae bacterium]|jgi:uncharacterized cupredoxin-like copper-binding protein
MRRAVFLLAFAAAVPASTGLSAAAPAVVDVSLYGDLTTDWGIKAAPDDVGAGQVVFRVRNDASYEPHDLLIVRGTKAELSFDKEHDVVDLAHAAVSGSVTNVRPGTTRELAVTLAPGDYVLLCNIRSHFAAGMATPFHVNP